MSNLYHKKYSLIYFITFSILPKLKIISTHILESWYNNLKVIFDTQCYLWPYMALGTFNGYRKIGFGGNNQI